jgi:hypothetical protein
MQYDRGPDTLISVGDTILFAGGAGIVAESGRYLSVDAAFVDSANGNGIQAQYFTSVLVRNSTIRGPYNEGISLYSIDSLTVDSSAIVGAWLGVDGNQIGGAARIYGTRVDSSYSTGVAIYVSGAAVPVVVDSSRIAGNAGTGIDVWCDYCVDSALVTHSTITGNDIGLVTEGNNGGYYLTARNNNIAGNVRGGAANNAVGYAVIDADTNYWGDQYGPTCRNGVTGCDERALLGDSILTQGITFTPWLADSATSVMLAPRNMRPVARRPAPVVAAAAARPARAATTQHPFALRPAQAQLQPRPPLMTWRKGQQPRPAKVHHPS